MTLKNVALIGALVFVSTVSAHAADLHATFEAGEWNKTVQGVTVESGQHMIVRASIPPMVCGIPGPDVMKAGLQGAGAGLRGVLDAIEAEDLNTSGSAARALKKVLGNQTTGPSIGLPVTAASKVTAMPSTVEFRVPAMYLLQAWNAGRDANSGSATGVGGFLSPYLSNAESCLDLPSARAYVTQIRRILRSHLGLPPPGMTPVGNPNAPTRGQQR